MRQSPDDLKFAVLAVFACHPGGIHGYPVREQCEQVLGKIWQLRRDEIYRAIKDLRDKGWIVGIQGEPGSTRKLHKITDDGHHSLGSFLVAPSADIPRPMRQELDVKLSFATPENVGELKSNIKLQREACMGQLHALAVQRRKPPKIHVDPFFHKLLINRYELHVRAEIHWLDDTLMALTERFGPQP